MKQTRTPKTDQLPVSPDAVWRLLGLAIRAGRAVAGTEAAEKAIRRKRACLILLAEDTAENTSRQILKQCQQSAVQCRRFGSKSELGHWTGSEERAVAAVIDPGFARKLEQLIDTIAAQDDQDLPAEE